MDERVTIRRAVREDEQRVGDLWQALLEEQAELDGGIAPSADARSRWENDFPVTIRHEGRRLLVAVVEGRIVGFVSAQPYWPPPIYAGGQEVHIDELYIAPEFRGEGVGERLVGTVRGWAEEIGAGRIRLQALASNVEGLAFWERQGARPFTTTLLIELGDGPASEAQPARRKLGF